MTGWERSDHLVVHAVVGVLIGASFCVTADGWLLSVAGLRLPAAGFGAASKAKTVWMALASVVSMAVFLGSR